ncbi:MAG TPA: di-heme oxidoredictase family protein, partial [Phycisphaerae bacterium]
PGVEKIDAFTDFQQLLGVPPQWPPQGTLPGETVFNQVGCGACHIATWTTGLLSPQPNNGAGGAAFAVLANKTIHPYSDWLLHDIGTGDHIVFGDATGLEFRTTPLWGLRQRVALLHTGCVSLGSASTVEGFVPVIDAHGCVPAASCEFSPPGSQCEAQASYAAFNALAAAQRTQLLDFLGSLGRKLFDSADSWPGDLRINLDDWFFMTYCIANGGPGRDPEVVNPSIPQLHDCRLGFDSDLDGDTDLRDVSDFLILFNPDE